MAKLNKVCVNLAQDFTDAEKQQARQNIGAAASEDIPTNKSEIKVYEGGSSSLHKNLMTIYESSSTGDMAGITFNNENSNVTMVKKPEVGDGGKVLTVTEPGGSYAPYYEWKTVSIPSYTAGNGIDITNDQISWEYTIGRNLHINQNNQIQTNIPGGLYTAPTSQSNSFEELTDASGNRAEFAGAYRLACRHNPNDTYELALKYTASGMSGTITFTGTETVIMSDNSMSIHPAAYISEYAYYTPSRRFGADSDSTIFDPSVHKAIIYQGVAQIGPTSNTQIAIWQDNGVIKISFTSVEVGRVGSTL